MALSLQPDVVAVLALAGQEAQVFHPAQALAYAKSPHGSYALRVRWFSSEELSPMIGEAGSRDKEKVVTLL
jgi:hypothetical protein